MAAQEQFGFVSQNNPSRTGLAGTESFMTEQTVSVTAALTPNGRAPPNYGPRAGPGIQLMAARAGMGGGMSFGIRDPN